MNSLVSIVIPTYNRSFCLSETIDSCCRQTYKNIEILVCDDHSTDETKDLVEELQKNIPYLFYFEGEENKKGAQYARMNGVKHAKGEYIAFLDSDDILTDNSIEVRMAVFLQDETVDFVYGNKSFDNVNDYSQDELKRYLLHEMCLCSFSTMMIKKCLFDDEIIYMDMLMPAWQDDDIVMAIAFADRKMRHCGEKVMTYRPCSNSISKNHKNRLKGLVRMVRKYRREIMAEWGVARLFMWYMRIVRDIILVLIQEEEKREIRFARSLLDKLYKICHNYCKRHFEHIYG